MKKTVLSIAAAGAAIAFISAPVALKAADDHHHHGHSSSPNALKEEMQTLDGIFREVVSAVSLGDGERVHKALEAIHGAKEKTQEGVHKGEIKTPKNPDKMQLFEKMDNEFHRDLEALATAAHHNDQKKMVNLTKKLMDGCVSCHSTFRK